MLVSKGEVVPKYTQQLANTLSCVRLSTLNKPGGLRFEICKGHLALGSLLCSDTQVDKMCNAWHTYSSSRCLCESTMVAAAALGREEGGRQAKGRVRAAAAVSRAGDHRSDAGSGAQESSATQFSTRHPGNSDPREKKVATRGQRQPAHSHWLQLPCICRRGDTDH